MSRHRAFLGWVLVLVVTGLWRLVFGPTDDYLARLSPLSIWQLPSKVWPSIAATLCASVVAWISALLAGGLFGAFTASGALARRESGRFWAGWSDLASGVRRIVSWLYVVPLVLTISVVATILLQLELKKAVAPPAVALLLVVASGITLAGQRIFVAIDHAVTTAPQEDLLLASSLYLGGGRASSELRRRIMRICREARFLVECRIGILTEALEQSFHLAVVGVVILETVGGLRIYERVFQQQDKLLPWGGGIGRLILDGQSATNPTLVAGSVWLILIIDSLIAWAIRAFVDRKWTEPYRSRQ